MSAITLKRSMQGLALGAIIALTSLPGAARAQQLAGHALVQALQRGGYVLVMRHASSPMTPPTAAQAEPDNVSHERQLDDTGRNTSVAMGAAITALQIPIGMVWSSPTYRALQTARLAGLPQPKTAPELGAGGAMMQAAGSVPADWLKAKAAEIPHPSTDTVVITHQPNIMAAFGQEAAGIADGEALVLHTDGKGPAALVARIKIEDWPQLTSTR